MADLPGWRIEPLKAEHDRDRFSCGVATLDHYLKTQAGQDERRHVTATFVMLEPSGKIAGYYTLAAATIDPAWLPPDFSKKLPRYQVLPATLLGRLAVDASFRGRKLGGQLLFHALKRSYLNTREVGSVAVIVDALDDNASQFYQHHGFFPFQGQGLRLFLPMKTIGKLIQQADQL